MFIIAVIRQRDTITKELCCLFLYHLGIALMIWLFVGFVIGLKSILFDGVATREFYEQNIGDDYENRYIRSKGALLVTYTLGGLISVVGDIYSMFRKD
ncbi:hypothetical protein [Neobacillus niacini]|uniref:hypothetical protein n=1 Tax=Neobacillus niacini TaxID=86668 RepID=UPI00203B4ABD|nr:hypothetical protein [Neobacillus niacini]